MTKTGIQPFGSIWAGGRHLVGGKKKGKKEQKKRKERKKKKTCVSDFQPRPVALGIKAALFD